MERNKVLRVAAGSMALASVPVLTAACGGSDSNSSDTATTAPGTSAQVQTQATKDAIQLFVDSDTARGSANLPTGSADGCVQTNLFAHNEQIVWRMRVYDPVSGNQLTDADIASIIVTLKDGTKTAPATYGAHPKTEPNESFWTASWTVPSNYPSGSLDYTITATAKDGRTGTFTQLHFAATAMMAVTDQVRPIIPPTPAAAATAAAH
ncbi:MAG TPA: hypothetical protein VIK11_03965 [Tepidiformaceae bacterium]